MSETRSFARALTTAAVSCACALAAWPAAGAAGAAWGRQQADVREQSQEAPPRTAMPIELLGAMTDSADPAFSACLVRCAYPGGRRRALLLEAGATACDIAEIKEIRRDAVIVRNLLTDQLEMLAFSSSNGSSRRPVAKDAPAPAPPTVESSADRVSVELPKASVEHYVANLSEVLSSAQATPRVRDGAIDGFEINQIRAGSVVEQIGLKNGDVIVEVNGEKLDGLAAVMRLAGQAQAATRTTLTVLRGSQRLTFVFNTK